MVTEDYVQVPPDSTGKKMHTLSESVAGNTVETQVIKISDPDTPTQYAKVRSDGNAQQSIEDLALAIRYLAECVAKPIWYEPASGLLRVDTSLTTIPTLTTLTTLSQLAGYSAKDTLLNSLAMADWYQRTRLRIT